MVKCHSIVTTIKFYLLSLLFSSFQLVAPINIALHSQAKYEEHGWVAGSEVTTAGIKNAFQNLNVGIIDHVQIFAPFSYVGLNDTKWDFAVIEGYTGSVPTFIRRLRSINSNVLIIHYCLDTYPTLKHILNLDVNGFFTNSKVLLPKLNKLAPTQYIPLAADPNVMRPIKKSTKYNHTVVYLGHNSLTKPTLHRMLREALDYGLVIYGHNWFNAPDDLKSRWRGVLPLNDVAELYSSAKIVIGTTEGKQQKLGMINNRVYETMSCGSVLISDTFDILEDFAINTEKNEKNNISSNSSSLIYFDRNPGDTVKILHRLLNTEEGRKERRQCGINGRKRILKSETWTHRVISMLEMYYSMLENPKQKGDQPTHPRPLRPTALIVGLITSMNMWIKKAFAMAHDREFRVSFANNFTEVNNSELLSYYSLVVIIGTTANEQFQNLISNGIDKKSILLKEEDAVKEVRRDRYGMLCKKMYISYENPENVTENIGKKNDHHIYDVVLSVSKNDLNKESIILEHMMTAVTNPRRSAEALLIPSIQKISYHPGETIRFNVNLLDFVAPDHGMWCVRVNGIEVRCIGDGQSYVDIVVETSFDESSIDMTSGTMSIQTILRTHIDRKIFKVGHISTYLVSTMNTMKQPFNETVFIDGIMKNVHFYGDRSAFRSIQQFCFENKLSNANYQLLLNRILDRVPKLERWKDRTDRKINIAYIIDNNNIAPDINTLRCIQKALFLNPELYNIIFFTIGNTILNVYWINELAKAQIGIIHLNIPKELIAFMNNTFTTTTNFVELMESHDSLAYSSFITLINTLRGIDIVEFTSNNYIRSLNENIVSAAALNVGIIVLPHGIKGNAEMYSNFTNAQIDFSEGTLKIPKISSFNFYDRDRSGVTYFQQAQKLTAELKWQEKEDLEEEEETHLIQALPLFARRVRFHRGVPFNEWLTTVQWDNDKHNQMILAILDHRYQHTVSNIILHGKEIWNNAPRNDQTGKRELTYPKQPGWWPGAYQSRGNFYVTAKHKLHHDAEQFKYIVKKGYLPSIFLNISSNYTSLINNPERFLSKKMNEYIFLHQSDFDVIGTTYNMFNYIHYIPLIQYPNTVLNSNTNFSLAEGTFFSARMAPGLSVIDNFLSPLALSSLLEFLHSSTIWFDVKNGYLGACEFSFKKKLFFAILIHF